MADELTDTCGSEPGAACEWVLDQTGSTALANAAEWLLDKPLQVLIIVAVAWIANRLLRRAIKRGLRRMAAGGTRRFARLRDRTPNALLETGEQNLRSEQRVEALASVLTSVTTFVVSGIAIFFILDTLGVNLAPILAGAGIIGIALGFGSQTLVKDFLTGLFILAEDQYGVGDIVNLGEAEGVVEAVTLRTTRLRSVDGTVWHVPNGEITAVGNRSQHWSRSLLDIEVAYDTDIAQAKATIKRIADEVWEEEDAVVDEPSIWGVEALGANSVVIRLVVKTKPSEQWRISRLLRERIKYGFDEEGIEIPFPQQTVWHRNAEPRR